MPKTDMPNWTSIQTFQKLGRQFHYCTISPNHIWVCFECLYSLLCGTGYNIANGMKSITVNISKSIKFLTVSYMDNGNTFSKNLDPYINHFKERS